MLLRAARMMILGMLMVSIGFHWSFLQAVAWTGMIWKYSQETSSFCEAVSMTFDGDHPCRLCEVIRAGKAEEKKSERDVPLKKLELFSEIAAVPWTNDSVVSGLPCHDVPIEGSRAARPPVPPPRIA